MGAPRFGSSTSGTHKKFTALSFWSQISGALQQISWIFPYRSRNTHIHSRYITINIMINRSTYFQTLLSNAISGEMRREFAQSYTMFGLLVVFIFWANFLITFWKTTFFLVSAVALLVSVESRLDAIISESSQRIHVGLLTVVFLILFCGLCYLPLVWSLELHLPPPDSMTPIHAYMGSFLVFVLVFLVCLVVKLVLIVVKVVHLDHIKRGLFEMLHLCSVALASLIVTPIWVRFLGQSNHGSVVSLIMVRFCVKGYLFVKAVYLGGFVWDFAAVRQRFLTPRVTVRFGHASPPIIRPEPEVRIPTGQPSWSSLFICF
jgi:hypothetical protein